MKKRFLDDLIKFNKICQPSEIELRRRVLKKTDSGSIKIKFWWRKSEYCAILEQNTLSVFFQEFNPKTLCFDKLILAFPYKIKNEKWTLPQIGDDFANCFGEFGNSLADNLADSLVESSEILVEKHSVFDFSIGEKNKDGTFSFNILFKSYIILTVCFQFEYGEKENIKGIYLISKDFFENFGREKNTCVEFWKAGSPNRKRKCFDLETVPCFKLRYQADKLFLFRKINDIYKNKFNK